ncbi:MAG: trypsin-like peptidase domain-containing protein [Bdellovibrionales bacterium]
MKLTFLFSFLLTITTSFPAFAVPELSKNLPPWGLSTVAADSFAFSFEGIVGLSNCSGSIVRFENSLETDAAMVLTNGHCIELMPAGMVKVHVPVTRSFRILGPQAELKGTVVSTEILYGTMTKTDMAIYTLSKTFAQIYNEFNTRPFTLSKEYVRPSTDIEVISGYWKRGYACRAEAIIPTVKEDRWTWSDSIRYSNPGCETIGGTSGSPVLVAGTRTVIGVNNTNNENSQRCTLNNPCEVDQNGNITIQPGRGYAQQVAWIYSCLNQNRQLDLNKVGCLLPR